MAKIEPEFIIMHAEPGEAITDFARRMIARMICESRIVLGEFNQHTLEARPGSTIAEVIFPWDQHQRRSYTGE